MCEQEAQYSGQQDLTLRAGVPIIGMQRCLFSFQSTRKLSARHDALITAALDLKKMG